MTRSIAFQKPMERLYRWAAYGCIAFGVGAETVSAEPQSDVERAIQALQEQNQQLEQRLRDVEADSSPSPERHAKNPSLLHGENLILSGMVGLAFFSSEDNGRFPEDEFRVDEARLFLDVRLPKNLFAFVEVNLFEPDRGDAEFTVGELFLEAEDLAGHFGLDDWVTLRVGRFDIPFGEEYLHRDSIDNPLITHSVSDIWGVDEGIEIFGSPGGTWDYTVAVQNGGHPSSKEGNSDKAVIGRLGFEANEHLRISASAMRTGKLDAEKDVFSEVWFGRGFLVPVSDPDEIETFEGELYEVDVLLRREQGYLALTGGRVEVSDNGVEASTDAMYYSIEMVHDMAGDLYGALRYSGMESDDGFAVVGHAPFSKLFSPDRTESLQRLSVGLGYRISDQAVAKVEYSFEEGETVGGVDLDERNMLSTGVSFAF